MAALGKTPITVHDAPGFASSRLGVAIGLEAIRMLESGVASAEDIDAAMTLGYKHPIGPLKLTDIVGLDVRLGIAEYLHAELGDRFEPPALLRGSSPRESSAARAARASTAGTRTPQRRAIDERDPAELRQRPVVDARVRRRRCHGARRVHRRGRDPGRRPRAWTLPVRSTTHALSVRRASAS